MNPLAVVTLSKFDDIAMRFFTAPGQPLRAHRRLCVADELDHGVVPLMWEVVEGEKPFIYARNANTGIRYLAGHDILLTNDDVIFEDRETASRLQELAYSDLDVGILSPKVIGEIGSGEVCNAIPQAKPVVYTQNYIPFVCVFMRREIIDRVGPLDEGYAGGYGGEDTDYNIRVLTKGYRTAVAPDVVVKHEKAHSSYRRVMREVGPGPNADYHRSKWG